MKGFLTRIGFAALLAATGLALFAPVGHADPTQPNGCAVVGPTDPTGQLGNSVSATGDISCTYTATGGGSFAAATPNDFSITVTHPGTPPVVTEVASGGAMAPNPAGSFAAAAGDTVTVTVKAACAPGDPSGQACGVLGAVAAGEAPS
ncbi:MAG: hypothetical protein QOC92_4850 [Acidimicrobiaceae bacterium]